MPIYKDPPCVYYVFLSFSFSHVVFFSVHLPILDSMLAIFMSNCKGSEWLIPYKELNIIFGKHVE